MVNPFLSRQSSTELNNMRLSDLRNSTTPQCQNVPFQTPIKHKFTNNASYRQKQVPRFSSNQAYSSNSNSVTPNASHLRKTQTQRNLINDSYCQKQLFNTQSSSETSPVTTPFSSMIRKRQSSKKRRMSHFRTLHQTPLRSPLASIRIQALMERLEEEQKETTMLTQKCTQLYTCVLEANRNCEEMARIIRDSGRISRQIEQTQLEIVQLKMRIKVVQKEIRQIGTLSLSIDSKCRRIQLNSMATNQMMKQKLQEIEKVSCEKQALINRNTQLACIYKSACLKIQITAKDHRLLFQMLFLRLQICLIRQGRPCQSFVYTYKFPQNFSVSLVERIHYSSLLYGVLCMVGYRNPREMIASTACFCDEARRIIGSVGWQWIVEEILAGQSTATILLTQSEQLIDSTKNNQPQKAQSNSFKSISAKVSTTPSLPTHVIYIVLPCSKRLNQFNLDGSSIQHHKQQAMKDIRETQILLDIYRYTELCLLGLKGHKSHAKSKDLKEKERTAQLKSNSNSRLHITHQRNYESGDTLTTSCIKRYKVQLKQVVINQPNGNIGAKIKFIQFEEWIVCRTQDIYLTIKIGYEKEQ